MDLLIHPSRTSAPRAANGTDRRSMRSRRVARGPTGETRTSWRCGSCNNAKEYNGNVPGTTCGWESTRSQVHCSRRQLGNTSHSQSQSPADTAPVNVVAQMYNSSEDIRLPRVNSCVQRGTPRGAFKCSDGSPPRQHRARHPQKQMILT